MAETAVTPRVIVGVHDEVGDVALLRRAADEARRRHAVLVLVLTWTPTDGSERRAYAELDELVTDTFGPEEPVRVQPLVVRARNLRAAVAAVAVRTTDTVFAEPEPSTLWDRLSLHHHGPHRHGPHHHSTALTR